MTQLMSNPKGREGEGVTKSPPKDDHPKTRAFNTKTHKWRQRSKPTLRKRNTGVSKFTTNKSQTSRKIYNNSTPPLKIQRRFKECTDGPLVFRMNVKTKVEKKVSYKSEKRYSSRNIKK